MNVKQCSSLTGYLGFHLCIPRNVSKESACDCLSAAETSYSLLGSVHHRTAKDGEKGIRLEVFELESRRISGLVQSTNTSKYSVRCQSSKPFGELDPLACWICLKDLVNGFVRT